MVNNMPNSLPNASTQPCVPQEEYLDNIKLAHAYVPFQKLCNVFDPQTALVQGTVFPPLVNVYGWESRMKFEGYDDD